MAVAARDWSQVAAVLDVGTNSVLLLVLAVGSDGRGRVRDEVLATPRLGSGLVPGGVLDPAACACTIDVVVRLAGRARAAGAIRLWGFATAAVRRAANGGEFAGALAAAAGIPVEVLSAEDEARLAYAAVAHALGRGEEPLLVVDVGGGTTELGFGHGEMIEETASLPLGALALTETHLHGDPPAAAELAAVRAAIDAYVVAAPLLSRARDVRPRLGASGGTATALAALDLGLATYRSQRVHGHRLSAAALASLTMTLGRQPLAERARSGALDPGRAAILPAGALVLDAIVRMAGSGALWVSDHGVRHAYLRERLAGEGVAVELREGGA